MYYKWYTAEYRQSILHYINIINITIACDLKHVGTDCLSLINETISFKTKPMTVAVLVTAKKHQAVLTKITNIT